MTRLLPAMLSRVLAIPLALGVLIAGCAGFRSTDDRHNLQLWTLQLAPKFNDYITAVLEDWEREHPGTEVRWTDLPWGSVERKLLAAVFARTAPDVVNLNPPFAANLASKRGLLNLCPLLPEGVAELYLPGIWEAGAQGADQIAIPWYLTARISLVNEKLLRGAGLEAPPRTWDEVPAYARAVHESTGRYGLFVTVTPDDSAELLESMVQMGVTLLDEDLRAGFVTDEGRRGFAFWTNLYRDGLLPREVISQGQRRAIELYQGGELALLASGAEFLHTIQTNAPGVAATTRPHPPITGPDGAANVAVMSLAVPRQSAMPKEAVSLALFLTNAANQARFAELAKVLPSSVQALERVESDLRRESPATPGEVLTRDARLESARTLRRGRVLVPATPGIKRLQAIVYTALQRSMLGQISSDEAVEEAAQQWNRYAMARWPDGPQE